MTQDTDECPYRRLYTDISAWITDAKILSVFERTGHHGQYGGHKGSLLIPLATSVVTAASILPNAQFTPMMNVGNVCM